MTNPVRAGRAIRQLITATIILAILLAAPRSATAQAPQGHIAYTFPASGQRGKSVEATVGGSDLGAAIGVRVTGGGVTGKVLKVDEGKTATVSLTIAPDAKCGQRDLRLITSGGVTNRWRFIVGQLPEVVEVEPNSDFETVQVLPTAPVVVAGQIFEADKDLFRFSAKAGQTIVCRVQAQQLLPFIADAVPGWFQAVLTLYDAAGTNLAYVDDFRFHPDPVLIYGVERDGEYVIEIRDSIFRGREDFVYRLSIGELPYITHVYPLGGQGQSTAKVRLFGTNLPAHETILRPAPAGQLLRRVEFNHNGTMSNWLPFSVGETAESQENEPNNSVGQANPVTTPVTVNGRIEECGDVDCFVFTAQAKQRLAMEVLARRLDSPLDSIITVLDAKGQPAAQNDDVEDVSAPYITHHADSRLVHTFRSAGKYVLKIADIQGKGGPEFAYRLTISPPQPDFQLRVTPDNPRMGQGATTVTTVHALRRDGFDGQIDLSVEDLPEDFTANGTVIPAEANDVILTLTAPGDASLDIHMPKILGSAVIGGRKVTRQALPVEDVMQAFIYHHLLPTQEFLLSVVEPGPYKLVPQIPPEGYIRFAAGRTAFVVVKAVRKPGVKGSIRLTLHNPPKGVRMQGEVIAANEEDVKCEIRYPNQLPSTVKFNLIISGTLRAGKETLTTITPAILALGPAAKGPPPPKPAAKTPQPKPQPKPQVKPQRKPQPKPQQKPQQKTQPKPQAKPPAKPQTKTQPAPQEKPQPKVRLKAREKKGVGRVQALAAIRKQLAGVDLTSQQSEKVTELLKSYGPKLADAQKKRASLLTDEQRKARAAARKKAEAAGKTGRELQAAVDAAVALPKQQKAAMAQAWREMRTLTESLVKELSEILTSEQLERAELNTRPRDKGKVKKRPGQRRKKGERKPLEASEATRPGAKVTSVAPLILLVTMV